jgi:hypothetical protein
MGNVTDFARKRQEGNPVELHVSICVTRVTARRFDQKGNLGKMFTNHDSFPIEVMTYTPLA